MRQLLFTLLLLCPLLSDAQDTIIKVNGDEIESKIVEITNETIKFKSYDFLEGPIRNINVSDVFMVIYENGKREKFTVVESQTNSPTPEKNQIDDVVVKTKSDFLLVSQDSVRLNKNNAQDTLLVRKNLIRINYVAADLTGYNMFDPIEHPQGIELLYERRFGNVCAGYIGYSGFEGLVRSGELQGNRKTSLWSAGLRMQPKSEINLYANLGFYSGRWEYDGPCINCNINQFNGQSIIGAEMGVLYGITLGELSRWSIITNVTLRVPLFQFVASAGIGCSF